VSVGQNGELHQGRTLTRKDEIGILSREFNSMISRLAKSRSEKERARAFLETAVEHSPSGIVILDAKDGRVRWINTAALNIHGNDNPSKPGFKFSAQEAEWQGFRPDGSPYPYNELPIHRAIMNGEITRNETVIIRNAQGENRWVLFNAAPVRDSNGEIHAGILMLQDITERMKAEEAREKLQAQLIQAQKLETIGKLAGGVAHDFNNMLSVILGYTEIAMAQVNPGDALYNHLHEIQIAARRSADITMQLLAFARKQTIVPKVLDLNKAIEKALLMLRRLIGEDIELLWTPGSGIWLVKMDPVQVDQILTNLCINARDAIGGVGRIRIETHNKTIDNACCQDYPNYLSGAYVMITVSDDGPGMNRETRDQIFEPFFTTKGVGEGTGLGLPTVYGIVKQNNGFIDVYSEPGSGTAFKIYLPRLTSEGDIEIDSEKNEKILKGGRETVLVVEDERSILNLAEKILRDLGYTVLTANSSDEAMSIVEQHEGRIHLLVTDVVMPEMSGRDLADKIKTSRPGIGTLFMSGYTANIISKWGVLDEDMHFMQKPFSINDLAEKVQEMFTTKDTKDEIIL
jgi:two-component system, cell cycle sensor histidine kinase and response regulator CckA